MIYDRSITPWLCLCPLLAIASEWREAAALAIGLLASIVITAGILAAVRLSRRNMLRLPLAALVTGTVAALEGLALAAWWPDLDNVVAPWLAVVAGLAVLVCMREPESGSQPTRGRDDGQTFASAAELAFALSATLLIVGIARDGFGRGFLLANTPAGALVLLALLLAGIGFAMRDPGSASQSPTHPPPDSGPHRGDDP